MSSTSKRGSPAKGRPAVACAAALLACAGAGAPALHAQPERIPDPASRPAAVPAEGAQPPPAPITPEVPAATPPATSPTGAPLPPPQPGGDQEIRLSDFREPVDLRALVEWVGETLGINIAANDQLSGSVVINAPVTVRKDRLLELLNALLEQQGYAIYYDSQSGWYRVEQAGALAPTFSGELATTRVIPTPGVRPSSLSDVLNQQIGAQSGAPGTAARTLRVSYLDDLGVILLTDTPRRVDLAQRIVGEILDLVRGQQFIRFELEHVAASVARQRVLELLGQFTSPGSPPAPAVQPAATAGAGGGGAATLGLSDRLSIDPQGNALILRGYPDEAVRIERALAVIDRPKVLEFRQYFAGSAAAQIAEMAQRQGLGTVETIDSTPEPRAGTLPGQAPVRGLQQPATQPFPGLPQQQSAAAGGPVMIVDVGRGVILYYATASQHRQLASFIKTLDVEREQEVITAYKLKNVDSDDVADIITAMITGQAAGGSGGSAFLPERGRGGRGSRSGGGFGGIGGLGNLGGLLGNQGGGQFGGTGGQGRGSGAGITAEGESPFGPGTVFVVSDRSNNQVLVRAPANQQEDFAKLIAKLDQRRPQVYIEVQIVAVSATDDFRLAFEVQGINAGGTGGAVATSFGLTRPTGGGEETGGDFLSPRSVRAGLGGLTAAVIKSEYVPIVINTLKRDTDTRILSSPQILVDDNETAEIVSLEEQPTTSSSQGTATTQTSFSGFEEAGTTLSVTPSISEGGYMRLSYYIELSNFVGSSSAVGIPPVRQTREVSSDSVTIPGDTTIVVGGIKVDSKTNAVAKVPLIGDIPLVGNLFRDTSKAASNTRLYVFITPRIMRDPNFRDLMLLTRGPQADAGLAPDVPELMPAAIEIVEPPPPPPGVSEGATPEGVAHRGTHGRT